MHFMISCTAALEVPERRIPLYIHFNDAVLLLRAESKCKETTMLLSLIRMFQAFRNYQRNVAELSQLTDRELADIGLDRSDIPRVAAGNYNG